MGKKVRPARLPAENDKVSLVVDLPAYGLVKGDAGTILVAYDVYNKDLDGNDFEVYFKKIDTSVQLLEAQFKLT